MVTERMIINALILAASFVLVPFIISESLTVDYLPALILIALIGLIIAFFFIKENLAICPYLGMSVIGVLNFLPLPLTATHIFSILVILYYITGYVIIRQKRVRLGKTIFLWPIVFTVGIVLLHNHSLALGAFGGSSEGTKPAILMYLVTLGYFCAINLPTPSIRVMSRIPYYSVIFTMISSLPYLITTVFPGLAPYLYVITDSVNVESYRESVDSNASLALSKLAALGPVGSCVQLYLLCKYPIGTWLRPERWWMLVLSIMCAILVASSGYRSAVFGYFATLVLGAWCYYSWRAIILPVTIAVVGLVLLTASSNNMIDLPLRKLPLVTQRTLSFLPGDWDPEAIESGKSSNEFRDNIIDVYMEEYMARSPWFGNGFTIDVGEFGKYSDEGGTDIEYRQAKVYIEGKMFHTGWMSVYDCVGIVGTLGFIAFAFNQMRLNARFIFGPKADRQSSLFPLYVWIFCNLVSGFASYWTVFGSFPNQMIGLLTSAAVLSHLADLAESTEAPVVPIEIQGHVEMPRISGAYYGRR